LGISGGSSREEIMKDAGQEDEHLASWPQTEQVEEEVGDWSISDGSSRQGEGGKQEDAFQRWGSLAGIGKWEEEFKRKDAEGV
jgi:hypothetical protein